MLRRALAERLPPGAEPGNPVDLRARATDDDYGAAIDLLARDDDVDAIVAIFVPPLGTDAQDIAAALRRAAIGTRAAGVPLLGVFPAHGEAELRALAGEREVPLYGAATVAARALARTVAYAGWRGRQADTAAAPAVGDADADAAAAVIAEALSRGEGWLQPAEVEALVAAYGVPLAEARFAATPLEAGRCADELGGPVALKVTAPGLLYKSEAGGVRLGLRGAEETEQAAEEAASAVRRAGHAPEAFVVQRMAPAGVEMAAGVLTDPDFGPFVACGAAGRAVELLGDVTVRLAPVGQSEAADMIGDLRTFPLLDGYRGAPRMDHAALANVLVRLSQLAATHAELVELDCDPVLVSPAGAVVLDARAKVRSPSAARPFPALDR